MARQPREPQNPATGRANAAGTADADEVARFAAMAEEWWDPDGKFKPLHKFNPVRLKYIRHRLAAHYGRKPSGRDPLKDLSILDLGCGGGLISEPVAGMGATVTGIDAAEKNVAIASLHAEDSGLDLTYRHAAPEELVAEGLTFDVVLNLEVIEHVPDPNHFLDVCAQLVKPGGAMVLATISRTAKSLALAKIGAEYILRWLPQGTHDWRKFVKPSELARGLANQGMEIDDLAGMSYNPLTDSWSLTRDLTVNYLAFATKPKAN